VLPAWSIREDEKRAVTAAAGLPETITRDWAWGGSDGAGVRVCILDSGVERGHPQVGELAESWMVTGEDGDVVADPEGIDLAGHGTACASIVRRTAPGVELASVRVLGVGSRGSGKELLAGLRFALGRGYDVLNLSLSTSRPDFLTELHAIADAAYFRRTILVASAHNLPVESYPWRFASVVSVGSHAVADPLVFYANPTPPVEFFARGVSVPVGWRAGGSMRATGNSFAAPHIAALTARIVAKHPELTPFQLKTVLSLTASNMEVLQ
jgi:subtilisin family serine protease